MDLIQEHEPLDLKRAYSQLFEAIVVGELDKDGKRPLKFILREDGDGSKTKKPGVNQAENSCVSIRLAQEAYFCTKSWRLLIRSLGFGRKIEVMDIVQIFPNRPDDHDDFSGKIGIQLK